MTPSEPIGYIAALLVLATFCMRDMTALRVMAIISNLAFIAYGVLADVGPVLMLHLVLLPVNAVRLVESVRSTPRCLAEAPNKRNGAPRAERAAADRRCQADRRVGSAGRIHVVAKAFPARTRTDVTHAECPPRFKNRSRP